MVQGPGQPALAHPRTVLLTQFGDGFGNAVSPQVGTWIGSRLRAVLHRAEVAA